VFSLVSWGSGFLFPFLSTTFFEGFLDFEFKILSDQILDPNHLYRSVGSLKPQFCAWYCTTLVIKWIIENCRRSRRALRSHEEAIQGNRSAIMAATGRI
jgi:hypothetical protein